MDIYIMNSTLPTCLNSIILRYCEEHPCSENIVNNKLARYELFRIGDRDQDPGWNDVLVSWRWNTEHQRAIIIRIKKQSSSENTSHMIE
jgi:hypothetical protein